MSRRRPLDWLWVLGLPLLLVGLAAAVTAIRWLIRGDTSGQEIGGLAALATLFGGLGFIQVRMSYRANKLTIARNRMRRRFPNEPWRWRSEWVTGHIAPQNPGPALFSIATMPAPVGGTLRGAISVPFDDASIGNVTLELSAVHVYVTGVQKERRVHRDVVWEARYSMPLEGTPAGLRAEVAFDIPADAPPTSDDHPNDEIIWLLKVTGERPDQVETAAFVVPVFSTPG